MSSRPSARIRGSLLGVLLVILASGACASAATRVVTNCRDWGPGSLRETVAAASSGDTVDLTALDCDRIVFSRAIRIPQRDLTIVGRSRYALTLDGNQCGRVFNHAGEGTLRLQHLSIARGYHTVPTGDMIGDLAEGGCVFSRGSVELFRARVHHCRAFVPALWNDAGFMDSEARGGGIYATNRLTLLYSSVFYNSVGRYGYGGGAAGWEVRLYRSQVYGNSVIGHGGGVFAFETLVASYSTAHANRATFGGGLVSGANLSVYKSTVSSNVAEPDTSIPWPGLPIPGSGGGIMTIVQLDSRRASLIDSTVSGNSAIDASGVSLAVDSVIANSTIAFNRQVPADDAGATCPGGAVRSGRRLQLESTIIARNTCGEAPGVDLSRGIVTGTGNLVSISAVSLPAGTMAADPRLLPLADNGGPTRTHLTQADSPAIDQGSNVLGRAYDQRGRGYPRVKGNGPDIGAVER